MGMTRALLLAALAALALAAPASARTVLVDTSGQPLGGRWQSWVDKSLMPTPDRTLTVSFTNPSGTTDHPAYFQPDVSTDTLFVPPPAQLDRHQILHEIGHFYDYTLLSDVDREAIMRSVLGGGRDWRIHSPSSAHEQFAEAFAFEAEHRCWRDDAYGESVAYYLDEVMTPRAFRLLRTWLTNIPLVLALRNEGSSMRSI